MAAWQAAFFLAPLLFLIWMTFWRVKSFRLTPDFVTANWAYLFGQGFFYQAWLHSVALAAFAAVLASAVAFPAAWWLAFLAGPRARRVGLFLLIAPFFTSYLVRVYGWIIILSEQGVINVLLSPTGLGPLHLLNSDAGTLIGYLTLTLPLVMLLQTFALRGVDGALIEAAHNLRCPPLRTARQVVIPAARVGLVLAAAFAFVLSFGDYVSPGLLGGSKPPTLSILLADQVKSGNHWPRASVVAVVMIGTLFVAMTTLLRFAYAKPVRA